MTEGFFTFPVQLGFDVATSITIIGSLVYFVFTMKKKVEEERSQRFDKNARAVAAGQLTDSIKVLSRIFIEEIVGSGEEVKKFSGFNARGEDRLHKMSGQLEKETNLDMAIEGLGESNRKIIYFYEVVQTHRYNIIPVIDSIEESSVLVRILESQISSVADEYRNNERGLALLLKELKSLSGEMESLKTENNVKSFKELSKVEGFENKVFMRAASIMYDESYYGWTESFIPSGKEDAFLGAIEGTSKISEMDGEMRGLFLNACSTLIGLLYEDKHGIYAQVIDYGVRRYHNSTETCKEILITLSAILKYLLSKDGSCQSIEDLIDDYKSDEYFSLSRKLR